MKEPTTQQRGSQNNTKETFRKLFVANKGRAAQQAHLLQVVREYDC